MASIVTRRVTPEEYLELERAAETKSEYRNGEIVPMAGPSFKHAAIVMNLVFQLMLQLRRQPYWIVSTDLRLAVRARNLITYPDVMVIAGDPHFAYDRDDVVLNPVVIIEVLSKSTQKYDRGEEFASYRTMRSLKEYVMVAQDKVHVERWLRQPDEQWTKSEFSNCDATVQFESIDVDVRVADIYEKIDTA